MIGSSVGNQAVSSYRATAFNVYSPTGMVRAKSRRWREISMSMAPPPGTIAAFFTARRTISMASLSERVGKGLTPCSHS